MLDLKLFISLMFMHNIPRDGIYAKCNKINFFLFLLIKAKVHITLHNFPCRYNFTLVIIISCRDGIFLFHRDLNTNPVSIFRKVDIKERIGVACVFQTDADMYQRNATSSFICSWSRWNIKYATDISGIVDRALCAEIHLVLGTWLMTRHVRYCANNKILQEI